MQKAISVPTVSVPLRNGSSMNNQTSSPLNVGESFFGNLTIKVSGGYYANTQVGFDFFIFPSTDCVAGTGSNYPTGIAVAFNDSNNGLVGISHGNYSFFGNYTSTSPYVVFLIPFNVNNIPAQNKYCFSVDINGLGQDHPTFNLVVKMRSSFFVEIPYLGVFNEFILAAGLGCLIAVFVENRRKNPNSGNNPGVM